MTWEIFHNRMLSRIKNGVWSGPQTTPKLPTLGFSPSRLLGPAPWNLTVSLSILKKKILQAVSGSMLSTFSTISYLTQPRDFIEMKKPNFNRLQMKRRLIGSYSTQVQQ